LNHGEIYFHSCVLVVIIVNNFVYKVGQIKLVWLWTNIEWFVSWRERVDINFYRTYIYIQLLRCMCIVTVSIYHIGRPYSNGIVVQTCSKPLQ
jgi:hypothetical protein